MINPNGQASNTVNFQVTAPAAPAITSLTPNPFTGSNAVQTLTINGSNFQPGEYRWRLDRAYTREIKVTVVSATNQGLAHAGRREPHPWRGGIEPQRANLECRGSDGSLGRYPSGAGSFACAPKGQITSGGRTHSNS